MSTDTIDSYAKELEPFFEAFKDDAVSFEDVHKIACSALFFKKLAMRYREELKWYADTSNYGCSECYGLADIAQDILALTKEQIEEETAE